MIYWRRQPRFDPHDPAELLDLLARLEWSARAYNGYTWTAACPVCARFRPSGHAHNPPSECGHDPTCELGEALSARGQEVAA